MFEFWKIKKGLRDELIDLEKYHYNLVNTIESYNGSGYKNVINRSELAEFPMLVWVELNDKVSMRRRRNIFKNYLNFDTKMSEGGELGIHFHSDMIESCEVIDGLMLDLVNNKEFKAHDIMHYDKGEQHHPVAIKDSILKIIFKT